jgi:hypothetical protein
MDDIKCIEMIEMIEVTYSPMSARIRDATMYNYSDLFFFSANKPMYLLQSSQLCTKIKVISGTAC